MNFLDNLVDIRTKELDLDNKEKLARAHFLSLGFVKTEDKDEYKYVRSKFGVELWISIYDVRIYITARCRNKIGGSINFKTNYNDFEHRPCILISNFHDYDSEQVEQIFKEIIEKCEYGRRELIS